MRMHYVAYEHWCSTGNINDVDCWFKQCTKL